MLEAGLVNLQLMPALEYLNTGRRHADVDASNADGSAGRFGGQRHCRPGGQQRRRQGLGLAHALNLNLGVKTQVTLRPQADVMGACGQVLKQHRRKTPGLLVNKNFGVSVRGGADQQLAGQFRQHQGKRLVVGSAHCDAGGQGYITFRIGRQLVVAG